MKREIFFKTLFPFFLLVFILNLLVLLLFVVLSFSTNLMNEGVARKKKKTKVEKDRTPADMWPIVAATNQPG